MPAFFGQPRSHIIFAADLDTYDENAAVLEKIASHVDVIKVNCPLLYREGPQVMARLRDSFAKPVFADIKIADVPHTDRAIIDIVRQNGGAAAMVHGFVGPDALEACLDASRGEIGIIVQLELTNPGGRLFTAPLADDMAALAASLGVYGMQAPGNRPQRIQRIRHIVGAEPVLVCCGVGAQGGHYREVLEAGGTYAIIGRAIYLAPDPRQAVLDIVGQPT